jgi:hypothetical protein
LGDGLAQFFFNGDDDDDDDEWTVIAVIPTDNEFLPYVGRAQVPSGTLSNPMIQMSHTRLNAGLEGIFHRICNL